MLEIIIENISLNLILIAALLFVFIGALSLFISLPKPGENPFKSDSRKPLKALEKDQKARDKVLKQGFTVKNVPENLDAIVIGSGIGGLSAAAILSKVGKKVLVLEQHDQAGGCCHSFIEKGFEFDVGIHYIGELRTNTINRTLVDQITDGQLQWCDLAEEFDLVALGEAGKQKFYPYRSSGPKGLKAALLEKFPAEEKAIDKFIKLLREVKINSKGMAIVKILPKWLVRLLNGTGLINYITSYFKYARRTTKEVLDELTDNDALKAVLAYCWGDYGSEPGSGSFALHAMLINHFMYGASYPRGGSSEIAYTIIPVIERSGGRVLVRAPVTQILTDSSGKAIGVKVQKGSTPVNIYAPLVISDAGVVNTLTRLLPLEVARKSKLLPLLGTKIESGFACMSLFVGLNGTTEELGLKPNNIWSYTGSGLSDMMFQYQDYLNTPVEDIGAAQVPFIFVSFPSTKDPTFAERFPGKTVCEVVSLGKWEWFSQWEEERVNKRGIDYEAIKKDIANRVWDHVLIHYPHLVDKVEYFEVGSPVTNKHYIASPQGEIYGLDHTAKRFGCPEVMMHLRPQTEIPNLLLTGQDVASGGFTGALFGGLLCAATVLNRNLYDDVVQLRNKIAKSQ